MRTTIRPAIPAAIALGLMAVWLGASAPAKADAPIGYEQASLLAATCYACHGTDGRLAEGIAPLAGRNHESLRDTLHLYRDGSLPSTVMKRIITGYSAAEIDAIATYLSGLPGAVD
jgi:cytochrome subunit of sulfide dehydrogenase